MGSLSRRDFLKAAGAATVTGVADPSLAQKTKAAQAAPIAYTFLNPQEARFIEAATARLIPYDEVGPGAIEAGVPNYFDKQLGGAWGAGERLYRSGPWQAGTPEQGYQLSYTPAELFRVAMRAIANDLQKTRNTSFDKLDGAAQDEYLTALQNGEKDLDGIPSKVFFESLLAMTIEGYFCDPVYGGNKDMVTWEMIGFPGAYANFYDLVDQHNVEYRRKPMSLAENAQGHVHIHPQIPASVSHLAQTKGGK